MSSSTPLALTRYPSREPYRKLPLRLRLRIRSRPRRRAMSISLSPTLPNYESFLNTGRYIPSVHGLAEYLMSHCKLDGYINISRAHGTGSTDTITFMYEQGQCWATGHFVGNGERDGDWKLRCVFKKRERTAVECIVSCDIMPGMDVWLTDCLCCSQRCYER